MFYRQSFDYYFLNRLSNTVKRCDSQYIDSIVNGTSNEWAGALICSSIRLTVGGNDEKFLRNILAKSFVPSSLICGMASCFAPSSLVCGI